MKKFNNTEEEYASLLGLFTQPNIDLDLQNTESNLAVSSPSPLKSEQDFEYDIYVVSRLTLASSFYIQTTGTYASEDLLVAYKSDLKLDGLKDYGGGNFKSVVKKLTSDSYKKEIANLVNAVARFNQGVVYNSAFTRPSIESSCDQILNSIYDSKHHWFRAEDKPFGIYVRARIKGSVKNENGDDFSYTIPNDLMKSVMDTDNDDNKSDYDKLLLGEDLYVSKYEPSPVMQFLTQDELKKELYGLSKKTVANIDKLEVYSMTADAVKQWVKVSEKLE